MFNKSEFVFFPDSYTRKIKWTMSYPQSGFIFEEDERIHYQAIPYVRNPKDIFVPQDVEVIGRRGSALLELFRLNVGHRNKHHISRDFHIPITAKKVMPI